jgi:hypothetical protein
MTAKQNKRGIQGPQGTAATQISNSSSKEGEVCWGVHNAAPQYLKRGALNQGRNITFWQNQHWGFLALYSFVKNKEKQNNVAGHESLEMADTEPPKDV